MIRVPAAYPARQFRVNFLAPIFRQLNRVRKDRLLALAFAGNTYFYFAGCVLSLNLFFYGTYVLRVGDTTIGIFNVLLALGIGAGRVAAGYTSGVTIEHRLATLGAAGLSVISALLAFAGWRPNAMICWLSIMGFRWRIFYCAGFSRIATRSRTVKKRRSVCTIF